MSIDMGDSRVTVGGSAWGLDVELDPEPWKVEAICAQTDPESFFPEKGGSTRDAKRICYRCPVRAECLKFALDHDERFGIWGGYSERERRRIKRGQPIPRDNAVSRARCEYCGASLKATSARFCSDTCRYRVKARQA